jgi:hypothetical protein
MDPSLLLNRRGWRRLKKDRHIWRRTVEGAKTVAPFKKNKNPSPNAVLTIRGQK